jgi:hypothetical protein
VGVPSYVRDPPSRAPLCTRDSIQGKRKERNDEGQQVAAEKKRRKNRKEKKRSRRERVRQLFGGEKERKIEFFSQPFPSEIGVSFVVRS